MKAILVSNCGTQVEDPIMLQKLKDELLASLHDCVAVTRYVWIINRLRTKALKRFIGKILD